MRIQVIDDDPIQLELAKAALETCGYCDVTTSLDTKTLFEADEVFDAYFLDILMPDTDGIEICRRLRADPRTAKSAVIMMTAMSDRSHIDAAFRAGADDYIIKPFDPSEISMRLARVREFSAERTPGGSGRSQFQDMFHGVDLGFANACGLTHHSAMEAYVSALDRGRASLSMATAFRLNDWGLICGSLSPADELALIGKCAGLMKDHLGSTTYVLSYYGGGTFLCITRRADPVVSTGLARRLGEKIRGICQAELVFARAEPKAPGGDPIDLIRNALASVRSASPAPQTSAARSEAASLPDLFSF